MKKLTLVVIGVLLTMVLLVVGCASEATPDIQPTSSFDVAQGTQMGSLAPNFQLNNLEGEPVSLSDFRGGPVLLTFWATWCGYCRAEMPIVQQMHDEWQSKGLTVLTVNLIGSRPSETPDNLASFMQSNEYSYTVLLDMNQEVSRNYAIVGTPTSFLIDKYGIIWERTLGPYATKAVLEESINRILPN